MPGRLSVEIPRLLRKHLPIFGWRKPVTDPSDR